MRNVPGLYGYSPSETIFCVGMGMKLKSRLKTHRSSCGHMDIFTLIEYPTLTKEQVEKHETYFKEQMSKRYELVKGTTEVFKVPSQEDVIEYLKSIDKFYPDSLSEENRTFLEPRKMCEWCAKHPVASKRKGAKGERKVLMYRNKSMADVEEHELKICQSCWTLISNAEHCYKMKSGDQKTINEYIEKMNKPVLGDTHHDNATLEGFYDCNTK